ncbi:gas vesicle protein [Microbispora sp. RL4-1S]|uniref:Gas vesicle protein n=1 Tax=Microbispora oryzae TaxID=2806554 RepID=A0A940WVA4_9ACTN|nr:gas vesicle protein GvpO [Microbispora oryzae]MBP2707856.1 gas vesicle protein [Microbispora oryzae]
MPPRREAERGGAERRGERPRRRPEPAYDEAPYEPDEPSYGDDAYEEAYEAPPQPRRRALTAVTAGQAGLRHISGLTSRKAEAVTLVQPVENGWVVDVEVLEDHRIPSSGDLLATYEAEMDGDGNLLSYRRTRRYRRGTGECGEGPPR